MKKKILANYWVHKKFPGKGFAGYHFDSREDGRFFILKYIGPRGGKIMDTFFSWQDAKAAGWKHVKKAKKK